METDTLKYDFGTTPEEVIRERLAALQGGGDKAVKMSELSRFFVLHRGGTERGTGVEIPATDPDDLITVLDALKWSSDDTVWSKNNDVLAQGLAFRKLRVEILAALGIDERGAVEPDNHGIASACPSCGIITAIYDGQDHHRLGCPVRRAALGITEV